jgi:hypothetical protein
MLKSFCPTPNQSYISFLAIRGLRACMIWEENLPLITQLESSLYYFLHGSLSVCVRKGDSPCQIGSGRREEWREVLNNTDENTYTSVCCTTAHTAWGYNIVYVCVREKRVMYVLCACFEPRTFYNSRNSSLCTITDVKRAQGVKEEALCDCPSALGKIVNFLWLLSSRFCAPSMPVMQTHVQWKSCWMINRIYNQQ